MALTHPLPVSLRVGTIEAEIGHIELAAKVEMVDGKLVGILDNTPKPHAVAELLRRVADELDDAGEQVVIRGRRYKVVEWDSHGDQGHGYEEWTLYATPIDEEDGQR